MTNQKPKTRAEIEADIASKKKEEMQKLAFEKERDEIKKILIGHVEDITHITTYFLSNFKAHKPENVLKYKIDDFNEIIALKQHLNELTDRIDNLKIPNEVKLKQEVTHKTDKVSHKFLWRFFGVSIFVIAISFGVSAYFYSEYKRLYHYEEIWSILDKKTHNYLERLWNEDVTEKKLLKQQKKSKNIKISNKNQKIKVPK